ncbi:multidrug effflux MFS transporter [Pseudogemmobacter faecipullorum]|uniref:Bcr/CflA family efflux transporter n=1 Tax=Pseudogemmobacter faecipullorum TaxID=2755041 RepID=A0ABS8CPV9_9RHOB|nr:multidrug effflux MFS transporter [Pseudogemmobacter faecipullorum]MCB5411414.1 multidrug effflux MFS transporter [Pseudogemmobacter faecipullorum]
MRDPLFRMALLLGVLSAVGPFAIDMYLPALPSVARDLGVDEARAALTLTAYFITFGIAQMLYGPMADAIGRKKPILLGMAIFILATFGAAFAPDMSWLLVARAIQGFGAATLMVVPRAVIRDMASGPDAARMMAGIMIVIAVSPLLAPLGGSAIMASGGTWREIFLLLAVVSCLVFLLTCLMLPETLKPENRRPVRILPMLEAAKILLTDRRFMGLTMINGFGMAAFFVFLATASFVYTEQYQLSPTQFSLAFGVNAIGFFAASQFAGRLTARYGMERVISLAVTGFTATLVLLALLILAGAQSLWLLQAGLGLGFGFLGLVMPTATVMALDPHPTIAGMASSLGGTIQMLTGGAMIAICGPFLDNSTATMVPVIALSALLAWVSAFMSLPRLRFFT